MLQPEAKRSNKVLRSQLCQNAWCWIGLLPQGYLLGNSPRANSRIVQQVWFAHGRWYLKATQVQIGIETVFTYSHVLIFFVSTVRIYTSTSESPNLSVELHRCASHSPLLAPGRINGLLDVCARRFVHDRSPTLVVAERSRWNEPGCLFTNFRVKIKNSSSTTCFGYCISTRRHAYAKTSKLIHGNHVLHIIFIPSHD